MNKVYFSSEEFVAELLFMQMLRRSRDHNENE